METRLPFRVAFDHFIRCPVSSSPSCSVTMPKKSWRTSSWLVSWESLFYWVLFTWLLGDIGEVDTHRWVFVYLTSSCTLKCSAPLLSNFKGGSAVVGIYEQFSALHEFPSLFIRAQDSGSRFHCCCLSPQEFRVSRCFSSVSTSSGSHWPFIWRSMLEIFVVLCDNGLGPTVLNCCSLSRVEPRQFISLLTQVLRFEAAVYF